MDFLTTYKMKPGKIGPDYLISPHRDLIVKGGQFCAFWDGARWNTDIGDFCNAVDKFVSEEAAKKDQDADKMLRSNSGHFRKFQEYCKVLGSDSIDMDSSLTFMNTKTRRDHYATKCLPYSLEEGECPNWDHLVGTLYSPEERKKIEWVIGAIVTGDSKRIQKFLVLYGAPGAGKSTIINVMLDLFEGYTVTLDMAALASSNSSFATAELRKNPLLAIQGDGDLSKIETNAALNSIVAHESIMVNDKYMTAYPFIPKCMLVMATNKAVKITDAQSGLLRRMIVVQPSGRLLGVEDYVSTMEGIKQELGAIAWHCKNVYKSMGRHYYDDYKPIDMQYMTDRFFNFVEEQYFRFKEQDYTTLKEAYDLYIQYCNDAHLSYIMERQVFREELKHYWRTFNNDTTIDGAKIRNVYRGFLTEKFEQGDPMIVETKDNGWLSFFESTSKFDKDCADCQAQYANDDGFPCNKWDDVTTKLSDIDTTKLHYIRVPTTHIVIDLDIKNEKGEKDYNLNREYASQFPPTYAELSKSGQGIHLHYIYAGDPLELDCKYDDDVEIKVYKGKSALRRKLTKCNNLSVATMKEGRLPKRYRKENNVLLNLDDTKGGQAVYNLIKSTLEGKSNVASHKSGIDWINEILDKAYKSGIKYDVTVLRPNVMAYANASTNNAVYCLKLVNKMHFCSEDSVEGRSSDKSGTPIIFDIEVFPNWWCICWSAIDSEVIHDMVNPTPEEVGKFINMQRLWGYNCRRYDNHVVYGAYLGNNNLEIFDHSKRLISNSKNAYYNEAWNISEGDLYDISAVKQSLKKWEIQLGEHHQECPIPWDKPITEEEAKEVLKYCHNDVRATKKVFRELSADIQARNILSQISGLTMNDPTNSQTKRIIFDGNKTPQNEFCYRNLGEPVRTLRTDVMNYLRKYTVMTCTDQLNAFTPPVHEEEEDGKYENSALPYFPGYKFDNGKSYYRGEEVGEGGYVYAEPGIYKNIALLDIASMHPTSLECECLFGPKYTERFSHIKQTRIFVKHKEYDKAKELFGGKLAPYLNDTDNAKSLAYALKIAINSVYGLTSAKFDNECRDPRNIDNIVAKRGALFMIDLKHEVQKRGFTVAHIKTDSIKIPDATPEIIEFVMEFGRKYGYTFEHEATYDRMCLVNDAVYIAHDKDGWHATGTQFQVPYVFKTLFSGENIVFDDVCETKSATTSLYLDLNEGHEDEHNYIFVGKCGSFCPVKPGTGGGLLMREKDGKYNAATGTKGYRWREAEWIQQHHREADIDTAYYEALCADAVKTIRQYGDFDKFTSPF